MSTFTPTEEQNEILRAVRETDDHLIISALAGAAKTSTLVLIAQALPGKRVQAISFNKRIAEELKSRLPTNCDSATLNSIGHRSWGMTCGGRLTVDKDKVYKIVTQLGEELEPEFRGEYFNILADVIKTVDKGKISGYVPDRSPWADRVVPLMGDEAFFASLDEEPSELMMTLVREASLRSIRAAFKREIDYNDQLFMPAVFQSPFHQYDVTLVDESQDLSALNHVLVRKLVKTGRLIAVGDRNQSIYAFRGAHQQSMDLLGAAFAMAERHLTISFRCPRTVVGEARWRAPEMKFPEWAIEGEVKRFAEWDQSIIPNDSVIICRNNAPLFSLAIRLIKEGRAPELVGNDIGKGLIKIMKKFGPPALAQAFVFAEIDRWLEAKLKKSRESSAVYDRADCMRVFAEQGETLAEAIGYAEYIFQTAGPVKLMTIHKSKGLEFDNVFILDRELIRKEYEQERNLLYVAQTRSKRFLGYITTDGFVELAR